MNSAPQHQHQHQDQHQPQPPVALSPPDGPPDGPPDAPGAPSHRHDAWLLSEAHEHTLRLQLAREAQRAWAQVPLEQRTRQARRVAAAIAHRRADLATLIHEENGKPLTEAIAHEIAACAAQVDWLCRDATHLLRTTARSLRWFPHRQATIERRAWGVVLIITPWNFPLAIPFSQVLAALLAGNAVILKPSELTPRCALAMAELFAACELPANLLQVVCGDGTVAAALIHERPDKIFFTGSLATGRRVMAAAAEHPIPVCMELGGVDAMIVLDDADLDLAAAAALWGGMANGGQICASIERLLVHTSVWEIFKKRFVDKAARLEARRDLGPVIGERQAAVYARHLQDAQSRGLRIECGGGWCEPRVLRPTLVTGDGIEAAPIYREESFGPLIAARTFDTDAEAVALHNDLWGGLTACVFGRNHARVESIAARLDAGLISINDIAATLYAAAELPWGGTGIAGFGRSHGAEGLLEFTRSRVIDRPRAAWLTFRRPWWFPYGRYQSAALDTFAALIAEQRPLPRLRHAIRLSVQAAQMLLKEPRF